MSGGKVVSLAEARRKREAREQREAHARIAAAIARGEGCPWSEQDLVEGWSTYVKQAWRPRRGIKRGCIKRMMRAAYAESERGKDWRAVSPLDLITAALPDRWEEENLEAASYLTMLFYDYLWRIAAISDDEKEFGFEWTRNAEAILLMSWEDG